MAPDNWVKRNPFISKLLFSALTIIGSFLVVKSEWARDDKKTLNEFISQKADKTYVDEQDRHLKSRIDDKADKSLVESMDKKLDLILQKLD